MKDTLPDLSQKALETNDVPAPIEQTVQEIVNLVPEEKREQALTRIVKVVSTMEEFRGMVPHPQHARQYEQICPGAFDRMLKMQEKELDYSIERDRTDMTNNAEWERRDQQNANSHAKLGMWLGFGLGIGLIIGAVICGVIGQPVLGGGLVAASAVSMVPAFLNGRRERGGRRDDPQSQQVESVSQLRQAPKVPSSQNQLTRKNNGKSTQDAARRSKKR